ncbi:PQ-loop domain-containing transporter [Paenibacillus sp. NFR01]|uniref:PQ-loop domain-containing transporter n=1 Tax=Paenibacillus sp. NFR01 TaxID=1566279 RepID=UPI0008B0D967|nr:PQ-loop domain-containing transporter [Paenibacillus sp. NFR01]SES88816.1 MtN3 and saliva related transmembrane protein [Paenibacillus sp. NFR01]
MLFSILQLIGGIILSVGWVPQIVQIIKTKSVKDLNLKSYLSMLLGIGLMEIYAVHLVMTGNGMAFLITNSLSLLVVSLVVGLILGYGKARKPTKEESP